MVEDKDFELLLRSMSNNDLKGIIKDYNDRCIKEGRKEDKIKGYSGYKKNELVDMLGSFLSLEEKNFIYENTAQKFKKDLVESAIDLIYGKYKPEKITDIIKDDDPLGITFQISGFSWENEAYVYLTDEKGVYDRDCDCRIGSSNGICLHQMAIFLMLLSNKNIKLSDIPLNLDSPWFSEYEYQIKMISGQTKSKNEADIEWADDYQIFINDNVIITQWGGPYPGKKIIDANELKESAEDWIVNKVTDKILKPIKVKSEEGYPNLIIKDKFDVLSKIMARPKLVKKILKKFDAIRKMEPYLPSNEDELDKFLRSKL